MERGRSHGDGRAPEARGQPLIPAPRRLVGRYRIESELGRGGMGAVFRAFDEGAQRTVALKLLESQDARLVALFQREFETLAMLAHPRVIAVYDYGVAERGLRYYTMELLDGGDLTTRAPLPWAEVCALIRDVCTSLVLLHAQKLVHRDVNPRNVRLDQQSRAKLIDFGALTNFGVANELVGTPACMAPEALRGQALDQRTDLFSLGAVVYWALTGRTPYGIRKLQDAEECWQRRPRAPSEIVHDVPKPLDELVLSLLSVDPLGRPASAAEVIDRLSVIGSLDDEALATIAERHIQSSALVGRATEQSQLELCVSRTLRGQGCVAMIDGQAGLGRTRMLSRLAIDARLAGLASLQIPGSSAAKPGALLIALARQLLEVAPEDARVALPKYLPALDVVLQAAQQPELHELASSHDSLRDKERDVRLSSALARWLIDVSARRPLLVAIDDAHLLHPSSAGVLSMIAEGAQSARLFLACTRLSGVSAPPAVEQLAFMGSVLTLDPIDRASVDQLAFSIFGDVPHCARVAQWLAENCRGVPKQVLERLHELVTRGLIRYAGGAWVLPSEINDRSLAEAFSKDASSRLASLSAGGRALAQLLCLQRSGLSEPLCFRLLPSSEPRAVRAALAELLAAGVVVEASDGYRVAEGNWRELLRETIPPHTLPKLHLSLARALLAASRDQFRGLLSGHPEHTTNAEIAAAINVGLHFLRGGDRRRGEALLRKGAIELTVRGDGLMAAAPDLEAAIETYRAQGRSRYSYGALMTVLTLAGTYTDWRLSYRYGEELIDVLCEVAGVNLAARLARFLGGRLALYVSFALSFVLFILLPGRRVATSFREVVLGVMGIGSAVLGVCPVLQDAERAARIVKQLHPLSFFPPNHVIRVVHEFQISLAEHAAGRFREAVEKGHRVLAYVQSPAAKAAMPPDARAQFEAGVHIMLGQMHVMRTDALAAQTIKDLDQLTTSTSRQTSASVRVAYHGHRGEREAYLKHLAEMDRLAAETGSIWRNDVMIPRMLWTALALCEDVMGLKRSAQQLGPLAAQIPTVAVMRDLTHACYLSEHGLPEEALTRYGHIFESALGQNSLRAAQHLGAYARILRKAGQPERAKQVCELILSQLTPADHEFAMLTFGARFELPLSLLALGEHERAAALLDAMISEHQQHDNPLLHGLTHGARAEVALATNARTDFERHLAAMMNWLRDTQHPALYAQYQRLAERGRKLQLADVEISTRRSASQHSSALISALTSQQKASPRALLLRTVQEAGAATGHVYLLRADGGLELASATHDQPLPEACEHELVAQLRTQANAAFETELVEGQSAPRAAGGELTTLVEDVAGTLLSAEHDGRRAYWFPLSGPSASTMAAGALVLSEAAEPLKRSSKLLLEQLAGAFDR